MSHHFSFMYSTVNCSATLGCSRQLYLYNHVHRCASKVPSHRHSGRMTRFASDLQGLGSGFQGKVRFAGRSAP